MKKEEVELFEARVVGLVWGLSYNTNFDVKEFNIEFDKIRKKLYNGKI